MSCYLLQESNGNYDKLVLNATDFLLKREVITNKCITQNDTIFITLKDKGKLVASYFYFNESLVPFQQTYICKEFKSRKSCLIIFLDNLLVNKKTDFEYCCVGTTHGFLMYDKNNEIEDIRYVESSH
jgi:hypothetical protein